MYEGRRDDNTSTEVTGEEIDKQWNLEPSHTFGEDREEGDGGGDDQNNEKGRNACSKMTVVIVTGCIESADNLGRIRGSQIDIAWVKIQCGRHVVLPRKQDFWNLGLERSNCLTMRAITAYINVGHPRGIARQTLPVPIKVFLDADASKTLLEMPRPTTSFLRFLFARSMPSAKV